MRIANILFHTSGRMELNLAQSQRGKLREFTDLGHNPKQFRICLTPSNSKNVQRVLAFLSEDKFYVDINTNQLIHCSCTCIYVFLGIHHTAPSACRPGIRLGFLGSI